MQNFFQSVIKYALAKRSLICGYLRHENSNIMIDFIIYLISIYFPFYHEIQEATFWGADFIGPDLMLSEDQKTITMTGSGVNTGYCAYEILPDKDDAIIVKFEISTLFEYGTSGIYVGIEYGTWNGINTCFTNVFYNNAAEFYAYCANGQSYSHSNGSQEYSDKYGEGDIIWMKLEFPSDIDYGKLYFKKNNDEWMDANYQIGKEKPSYIAGSCYGNDWNGARCSLSLLSLQRLRNDVKQRV